MMTTMIKRRAKSNSLANKVDLDSVIRAARGTPDLIPERQFDKLIKSIERNFGAEVVTSLESNASHGSNVEFIPTSFKDLDWLLGGGVPRGRIIELFGPEGAGKSTMAWLFVRAFQRRGMAAAYIDVEHASDRNYTKRLGVNIGKRALLWSQPDSGEQALDLMIELAKSKLVGIIVVDSVAALVPTKELEQGMDKDTVGLQARMMGKALRKVTGRASAGTTIVFVNQVRDRIGGFGFGNPTTTPGGRALKFSASVRLEVARIQTIKKKGQPVATKVKVKAAKNKVCVPFRTITGELLLGKGFTSFDGAQDDSEED